MPVMKQIIIISIIFAFIVSCNREDIPDTIANSGKHGVYILNEGNFSWSNASLSFFDTDSNKIYNHIFENANNSPLGDVAQSMVIRDSLAFVVLNNSGKIYVINRNDNLFYGKITGLNSPQYMQFVNDEKAYVSDLYQTSITIINPKQLNITGTIPISHTSEKMLMIEDKLFVLSWSFDRKLLVIDTSTDLLIDSLETGLQPNSMVVDKNNKLWILCDGGFAGIQGGQEYAKLQQINPASMVIEKEFVFSQISDSPRELIINSDGDRLFYINGGIYSMSVSNAELPSIALIAAKSHNFYSLGINPETSIIYAGDAVNYIQQGILFRYTETGSMIDSFNVGVIPGFIQFTK